MGSTRLALRADVRIVIRTPEITDLIQVDVVGTREMWCAIRTFAGFHWHDRYGFYDSRDTALLGIAFIAVEWPLIGIN